MKTLLKKVVPSAFLTGALTVGMVAAGTSEASAAPCGLSYQTSDVPKTDGALKIVYYEIRNCHNYTVQRKVNLAGTTDEPCRTVRAGQTVSDQRIITGWAAVRDLKVC